MRKMLSFPGRSRGINRRNLRHLESRRRTEQTVLQVDEVVFPDGSSVAGAGGTLESDVTDNNKSNTFQYAVTDQGVIDALASITAENVTVNSNESQNVNVGRTSGNAVTLNSSDQLPQLDDWHNVTPVSNTLPDQGSGSFAHAKSATPLTNTGVYEVGGATSPTYTQYVEIKEPSVYELEADMYWVSETSPTTEKTIATQISIARKKQDGSYNAYSGIGPVSTCFMFGVVRMGSTSVSTVTQCAAGDKIQVWAVGTLGSGTAPSLTSPPGRSSLRLRRISNHFNGHLSFGVSSQALTLNSSRKIEVYRGLPDGVLFSTYTANHRVIQYTPTTTAPTINTLNADTWVSGARDYYIKLDPPLNSVQIILATPSSNLILIDANYQLAFFSEHADADKYVKLLSGNYFDGLIRLKCGPGLNLNDLKAGVATSNTPNDTRPAAWLEFSFS